MVLGLKTIEIRRWPTDRRGPILIHASSIPDEREEVWRAVPPVARGLAQLRGGIIGEAELVACFSYHNLTDFTKDQPKHWNQPEWFQGPTMYGFQFERPKPVTFRAFPGWMRFFVVDEDGKGKKKRRRVKAK